MNTVSPYVFVIDDDESMREAVTEVLEAEGYRLRRAAHGLDGVTVLGSSPKPIVILLDLMMPVMDGWEFHEAQKRDPALADIPVYVFTAANQLRPAPVDDRHVIRKPIELDSLLS